MPKQGILKHLPAFALLAALLVGCAAAPPRATTLATAPPPIAAPTRPTRSAAATASSTPTLSPTPLVPTRLTPSITATLPATRRRSLGPRRPFPQHTVYTSGSIKPDEMTQAQLDSQVTTFYEAWKAKYLVSGCGPGRYYVSVNADDGDSGTDKNSSTVSEAHGYGMLITVLMAGYDPLAKTYFDGLYRFFKDHPSIHSPYLMAWNQDKNCADINGQDSATDGDMDIAYALLMADRQWGSAGRINYKAEALHVIQALKEHIINPQTSLLRLGDWANPSNPELYFGTRPSDFMFDHLRAYRQASADPAWTTVLDNSYGLLASLQQEYSPKTGLIPDFVSGTNSHAQPARPGFLEGDSDGSYSYNSSRVPWRVASDYLLFGDPRALALLQPINQWIRIKAGQNPALIGSGFALDGSDLPGNDYLDLSFVAPLGVSAMTGPENQAWLNGIWKLMINRGLNNDGYFGNTLKMLCMIVISGNWWQP